MDTGESFGAERGFDRSDSEALAGECLMGHGDTVVESLITNGMDSRDLSATYRLDVCSYSHIRIDDFCQGLCRSARGIELMTMMHLYHVRAVASKLRKQFRHLISH